MYPKKVLITGVTGLIGYATYTRLRRQPERYELYGLDLSRQLSDRVPEHWTNDIPEDRFFQCDLLDAAGLSRAAQGMEAVVHLAADPAGRGWESLLHNNIIGAYNVFEACRQAGVRRIVAASTIQVSTGNMEMEPYKAIIEGRYQDVPADFPKVKGLDLPRPRNLYAASKMWSESLAQVYAYSHGMSCLCVRPGWVVDQDRSPRQDSDHLWCSQADMAQLIQCCVDAPEDLRFGIYYGMSDNQWRWVDLEDARQQVGYQPVDRAEDHR
jgi:nucleoside-diphosphate-sugar epimerase